MKIEMRLIRWAAWVRDKLADLAGAEPGGVEFVEREVDSGRAGLFEILIAGRRVGCVVWRPEVEPDNSRTLVIMYAAGVSRSGRSLVRLVLPGIEEFARAAQFARVRFWTERRGLEAAASRLGYRSRSVVEKDFA